MRKIDAHIVILRKKKDNCKSFLNKERDNFIINKSVSPVEGILEAGIDVKEVVWVPFV